MNERSFPAREFDDLQSRFHTLDKSFEVHEAVCSERYKSLNFKLNIILGVLAMLLSAVVTGNPLVAFLQKVLG